MGLTTPPRILGNLGVVLFCSQESSFSVLQCCEPGCPLSMQQRMFLGAFFVFCFFCPTREVFSQPCLLEKIGWTILESQSESGHYLVVANTFYNSDSSFLSVLGVLGKSQPQEGPLGSLTVPPSPPPSSQASGACEALCDTQPCTPPLPLPV